MKNRLAKEKRKLYIMIMAVLLVVCFIVTCAYAIIRYQNVKERLLNSAELSYSVLVNSFSKTYFSNLSDKQLLYIILNMNTKENSQIKIKDSDGNIIGGTYNTFYDYFTINRKEYISVWITYDDFYNCLTPQQYEKIANYLNAEPEKENYYYELLCTEFYVDDRGLHPITLEIVMTNENHDWYVQDDVLEKFTLNAIIDENSDYYKSGEMDRNVIPTDFVLNSGNDEDIIGNLSKADIYDAQLKNEPLIHSGAFTYTFYAEQNLYYPVNDHNYENIVVRYAEKLDVLSNSLPDIAAAAAVIFLFFIITGIVMWIMTWQIIKNQALQEQKRREITNAMAHDLKTPLFIISGYAQNLKENIHTEKREHYADIVLQQAESVNALVHRMLELSKLDSLNFKPKIESFSLVALTDEVLTNYEDLPDGKSIEFEHEKECEIKADRGLIKSVLENLIDNAVKYSDKEKCISVEIKGKTFSVTNFCGNITKSETEQIWEPYYRQDKNSRVEGNGLGLSIVKSILELHKFGYAVKLKDGKITFSFTF